ncbi:MAG: CoB--CoM heterodisulfide reductase iron-sulfur subunit A family protein [Candidatus Desulfofervidaceae bacterium]|nr:CoB--CoM heterodisulfide reductase iron-sulfur subunit A family protein [Candidatus Desulfofervidaceae bacterium]
MNKVLVIGGGVGGVQAALELADLGYYVYLVESSPFLGGLVASLHRTYPVCFYCNAYLKFSACERHFNIKVLTQTQVEEVKGEPGNFQVTLTKFPRYVDIDKCTTCGICAEQCPQEIKYPFPGSLRTRKAIYLSHPSAVPYKYVVDKNNCLFFKQGECRLCEEVCPHQAINLNASEETFNLEVGAIIFAAGAGLSDAAIYDKYHYLGLPNVITSMEFEYLLKDSIRYYGHLVRPSDKQRPQKIAWLQCIGSRDITKGNYGYCSSVCCMYALKEAIMAKRYNDSEGTIFFMDLRAYGKHFEEYYNKAKEAGIRFVHSRVNAVEAAKNEGNVVIKYATDDGKLEEEEFDLVVLSVGLRPSKKTVELAQKMGLNLNHYHFVATNTFTPVETSRPGIYVCGTFQEPKAILDTTTQASAAAGEVAILLGSASPKTSKPTISQASVAEENPKIGVFVCQCRGNISNAVDIREVLEEVSGNPNVVYSETHPDLCGLEGRQFIQEKIGEHGLNRVIIAACTPKLYENHFREIVKKAGLNPFLMEMANLREQCAWVHSERKAEATQKAKTLIKMAIAKVGLAQPIKREVTSLAKSGLVVGGGIAGLTAALHLAKQGFEVYLIEKTNQLGGIARRTYFSWKGEDVQDFLKSLVNEVVNHPRIHVYTETEVLTSSGKIGNFTTKVNTPSGTKEIKHGITILATGAQAYRPESYLYGKHSRVMTLLDLQEKIAQASPEVLKSKNVVIVQCVGSRNEERPYCSRVCCTQSLKNALMLKEKNPEANIYILYRDIRTYGFREDLYREARAKGIVFLRYSLDDQPKLEMIKRGKGSGFEPKIRVRTKDSVLDQQLVIDADIVALAVAMVPTEENKKLAEIFRVPVDGYGFFTEIVKDLSTVDTPAEGVFICGLAQGPKFIDESIAQAKGAATRAAQILTKDHLELSPVVSQVIEENCDGCGYCVEPCPYDAISLIEYMSQGIVKKIAEVNTSLCQGCGICQATCPKNGICIPNNRLDQFSAMIDAVLETV